MKTRFTLSIGALALGLATQAPAQTVLSGDHSVDGDLCVGGDCTGSEVFDSGLNAQLKVKGTGPGIVIEDTGGTSDNDWALKANDTNEDSFFIEDLTAGTTPFKIMGNAPNNALFVRGDGRVGLGTSLPNAELHIMGPAPSLRIEDTGSDADFSFISRFDGLLLNDVANGTFPFSVSPGITGNVFDLTPTGIITNRSQNSQVNFRYSSGNDVNAIFIEGDNGNVGLGTATPDAPLEVSSDANFSFFRLTAQTAPLNKSVDVVYTKGPDDRGQLRYNIVEAGDSPQIPEMTLNADGDMALTGTLTTMGPTCAAGCDRVFDTDYALMSIEDHAALMHSNRHLPALGPTVPLAPVNVTERQGNIINELEHAHIYIAQLEARLAEVEVTAALVVDLSARLEALEAR